MVVPAVFAPREYVAIVLATGFVRHARLPRARRPTVHARHLRVKRVTMAMRARKWARAMQARAQERIL